MRDFDLVGVLFCVHLIRYQQQLGLLEAIAAEQLLNWQDGQAVLYVMAGGTAGPSQYKSSTPHPSPPAIGSAELRVGSILYGLRPLCVELRLHSTGIPYR
jgi:hypothetical protein